MSIKTQRVKWAGLCVAAVLLTGLPSARADEAELKNKIDALEKRLAELEGKSTQMVTTAAIPAKTLDFLGQTEISGFVSVGYLYDFSQPGHAAEGGPPPSNVTESKLRSFDNEHNEFMLNKFKLTLEKPVVQAGDKWDAGYRADLIFGQDAAAIQSQGLRLGNNGDLEQAFVAFNIPIGNGLKVIAGKTVTLMGVEVIEEVANPNWSEGNQFLLVENFTQTGLQLAYKWCDMVDTEIVVFNGWDVVKDNNNAKSFMGRVGLTFNDKTSLGLIGYGGAEQGLGTNPGADSNWRTGANLVFNRKLTDKLNMWVQADYGHEDNAPGAGKNAEWYAGGVWLTYDCTEKFGIAVRGDYLKDIDGTRIGSGTSFGTNIELSSATLTFNWKPMPSLQIRPEIRYDHSSDRGVFPDTGGGSGPNDRFTIGMGVAYLY